MNDDLKTEKQLTIVVVALAVVLNIAFFVLSGLYYDDKRAAQGMMSTITSSTIASTRLAFGVFSATISIATIATLFAPRWVSHGLAAMAGLAALIAAVFAARSGMPGALWMSLFTLAIMIPVLVWRSLMLSRAAWSFLAAVCYVLAVVLLFGAPKVRAQINFNLWTTMIIPGLLAVAAIGLTTIRRDYRDRN